MENYFEIEIEGKRYITYPQDNGGDLGYGTEGYEYIVYDPEDINDDGDIRWHVAVAPLRKKFIDSDEDLKFYGYDDIHDFDNSYIYEKHYISDYHASGYIDEKFDDININKENAKMEKINNKKMGRPGCKVKSLETGEIFDSFSAAATALGVTVSLVWRHARGQVSPRKTKFEVYWE